MSNSKHRTQHLFVVRTWQEASEAMPSESWRGSVEHVPSGQRAYFTTMLQLNSFILAQDGWVTAPSRTPDVPPESALNMGHIDLVQQSFAAILPNAQQLVDMFYRRLFTLDPTLRTLFGDDMQTQSEKFITMLSIIIEGVNRCERLAPIVQDLGYRHTYYGVKPAHYPKGGTALIWAIEQTLGEAFTEEMRAAWEQVYDMLANTMQATTPADEPNLPVHPED